MRPRPLVLFVEDDPVGQEIFEAMLADEGYELVAAASGEEALAKARQHVPDLVLLDVMMPGIDGFEVLRRLRADALLAQVPVILVTALADRESRLRGIESGADDFLTKPIDRLELRARVRTVTRLDRFRRLLAERARFEWVVETADDGYVVVTGGGALHYANPRARQWLGLPEVGDVPAEALLEVARRSYRCEPEAAWEGWPAAAKATRYLVRPEATSAPALWLQVEVFDLPSRLETGRLVRLRDVTERVRAQREVWAFHSAVNHKLRTPFTALLLSLELLAEELSGQPLAGVVAPALQGARRLEAQVQDVLQYLDVARRPWTGAGLALEELGDLATAIASNLGLAPPALEGFSDAAGARTALTRNALELVLVELLDNALKFHPCRTPQVELRLTHAAPGRARLEVIDDGVQLPPEQVGRAFAPYYQGERDHTGQLAGMGLGLPMVASILWGAGGACRLRNRADRPGVVVELELPLSG